MDLARLDGQADVVVGDEVTEAFGDTAQFEFQRCLLIRVSPKCPLWRNEGRRETGATEVRNRGGPSLP
jgi:hypothetical protein